MFIKTSEFTQLHADLEWMKDILRRIEEILKKDSIDQTDLETLQWLVKQGLKVERED